MKQLLICVATALLLLVTILGCGGDPQEQQNYIDYDPGSILDDCCGVWYEGYVSGISPPGGLYLWMALEDHDRPVVYGQPVYVESLYDTTLRLNVSYLDSLPEGTYFKRVYACTSYLDVGNVKKSVMAQEAFPSAVAGWQDSTCSSCCTKSLRRYKAFAFKDKGHVKGAGALMGTWFGQLCPDQSKEAQTGANVGIQNHVSGVKFTNFVQTGYHKKRWDDGDVRNEVFVEWMGWEYVDDYWWLAATSPKFPGQQVPVPEHGSYHRYKLQVDVPTGVLMFYHDDVNIYNQEAPWWQGKTARYAAWQGEIDGRETDMPGVREDPCCFYDCIYILNDGMLPWDANFGEPTDIIDVTPQLSGPDQWGIWYDPGGSTLAIWDEFPLGQ